MGNKPESLEGGPGPTFTARASTREDIRPATGRYAVLWMKDVVPTSTGNRDTVAEFRVLGTRG